MIAVIQIIFDLFDGRPRDGDQALLAPFSFHLDKTFVEINIREAQRDQFRHAQPAAIQDFEHRPVPLSLRQRQVDRV